MPPKQHPWICSVVALLMCGGCAAPVPETVHELAGTPVTPVPSGPRSRPTAPSSYGAPNLDQVRQWEMHEIVLQSSQEYENPFTDVEAFADFESEQGRQVRVYGFYDGNGEGGPGNLWKIRFMTGEQGLWHWSASSSDPQNLGFNRPAGTFEVIGSRVPGPLSPDPRRPTVWRHANGEPFLWTLGYSIHMLGADRSHPTLGGWEDYLEWLEIHEFNGVMFTLQVPSFASCSTCRRGMAPWTELGSAPPPAYAFERSGSVDYLLMPWARRGEHRQFGRNARETDFSRLYLPFWVKLDAVVEALAERGMIAHMMQYDDQTFHPPQGSQAERLYWDYILRRTGGYWNVAYNDGIDLGEYRAIPGWVEEWQEYFEENDPFSHPRSSRHGDDDRPSATWRSVQAADDVHPKSIDAWRRLMTASPSKPITEDDGIRALNYRSGLSAERFLQLAWWSVLSGPGSFGATWAGEFEPGNWYTNLGNSSLGMHYVKLRNQFILEFDAQSGLQIPFWKLEVSDELVKGDSVYCVSSDDGDHYLVYFEGDRSADLDLANAERPLPATWFDPLTGDQLEAGTIQPGGVVEVESPFSPPSVLYLGAGE